MAKRIKYQGLSPQQVEENRQRYGINVLTPPERESLWKRFFEKFTGPLGHHIRGWNDGDPLIFILEIAAVLSIAISFAEYRGWVGDDRGWGVFLDPLGILIAIMLATGIAFIFELKADREFALLNTVDDDEPVKVVRDGHTTKVPKRDIVHDDIVLLSTGDEVPADGELLEATLLTVDESSLTGEPLCRKSADPAMGDVYPEGTTLVPVGGSFTATAVPAEDYHFLAWMNGTTVVSTENPYTFVPTADITLTAAFEHNVMYYTVSVSCDTNKGTVDGTGTFEEGTEVTLTVNPKEGYAFAGWLEGSDLIEENPLTFTLTADRSLVVVFRTAGIDDVEGSSLALYPNPATTSVTLEGLANGSRVTLLSLNGRECGQWTAVDGKLTLDLSALAKGAYFVRVVSNNNTAVRKLIVK